MQWVVTIAHLFWCCFKSLLPQRNHKENAQRPQSNTKVILKIVLLRVDCSKILSPDLQRTRFIGFGYFVIFVEDLISVEKKI